MFTKWKGKIATIGGFLGFIIGALGFFEIYAKDVLRAMNAHYIWGIAALASFSVFIWGCYYWLASSRTTIRNVQSRIREWLFAFGYNHNDAPWPGQWHFGFRVNMENGPAIFIARPVAHQDQRQDYLIFMGRFQGVADRHKEAFKSLSKTELATLYARLHLESARAKMSFFPDNSLDQIGIEKWVPITSKFTAAALVETINEIYFETFVIWTTIALQFGDTPKPMPPSSTPGTGASPPAPT